MTWWQKLLDVKVLLLNIRDFGYFVVGTVQALRLLGKVRPDVVFLKGGFVGVPIGLAAAVRQIPIVTHDSDALPGLANRLVSRWVTIHGVALSAKTYAYPAHKTRQVGVLVEQAYKPVSGDDMRAFRTEVGLPVHGRILLITGGSLGATTLNKAIVKCVDSLLTEFDDLTVVHQVGKGKLGEYRSYRHKRLLPLEFLRPMHAYMGAADVVVTRGSANTIAELGVQGKPIIVVPSPYLANSHQIKNAEAIAKRGTAVIVYEHALYDAEHGLRAQIERLLQSPKERSRLGAALQADTKVNAAKALADILVAVAEGSANH